MMSVRESSRLTGLELFAGAGGLALGSAAAGVHHVALLDKDEHTCEMLRANKDHPLVRHFEDIRAEDVSTVDFGEFVGRIDIVTGGPPCQPFSAGGGKRGHLDDRDMFPHAIRSVREIRPKAFLFENVAGLYRGRFNDYREYVKLQLEHPSVEIVSGEGWWEHRERLREAHLTEDPEYRVILKDDVNAADYGLPQKRERILMMGFRADVKTSPRLPRRTHSEARLLVDQWITGEYWDRNAVAAADRPTRPESIPADEVLLATAAGTRPWQTLREALGDLPEPTMEETVPGHRLIPGARSYHGHDGSRLDWVAKALKAGAHGVPGGENCLRTGDGTVRYFTLRECARIQGFDDGYAMGKGAWTRVMKAFGNAVPVPVGAAFVGAMVEALAK